MNKIKLIFVSTILASFAALGFALPAHATGNHDICVPQDAYTEVVTPGSDAVEAVYETVVVKEAGWQRYSYNGKWESNTTPPPFPGEKWQANTASDPHGVGVEGAYFRSKGNSGNGDWFYLEATPAVTEKVLISPSIPAVDPVVIEHPAVLCDDVPAVIPNSLETSHTVGCVADIPTVTITLRNVSPWIYPVSVEIDGIHSYGPTVDNRTDGKLNGPQKDQSVTRTITFEEGSGEHVVRYRVDAGSEKDLYLGLPVGEWAEVLVDTDCVEDVPVVPEEPKEPTLAMTGPETSVPIAVGSIALLLGGLMLFGRRVFGW